MMTKTEKIDLMEKFGRFNDHYHPRIVAEVNGQQAKIAKFKGAFIWHTHEHEDELFMVIKGTLKLEFRDKTVTLTQNQMYAVPRGIEHRPVAEEEVWALMFEPATTINTGNAEGDLTRDSLDWI